MKIKIAHNVKFCVIETNNHLSDYKITGRVSSVTTSAVKSLDASAKSLDASAKYFGRVGQILGRVGEICWTRLVASARIPLRRHIFLTLRHVTFVASVGSLFDEMCFHDVVYISLDPMACVI